MKFWPRFGLLIVASTLFLPACQGFPGRPKATKKATAKPLATTPSAIQVSGGALNGRASLPAGVISQGGAGLLSDRGAGVVASNGAAYRVPAPAFTLLASGQRPLLGFEVRIVDATGTTVKDSDGKAYTTTTDGQGVYQFAKTPVGHNHLVQLDLPGGLGSLYGFLPLSRTTEARALDIEGVSTHVVGFVLASYIDKDQVRLDKLDAQATAQSVAEAEAALSTVAGGKLEASSVATADLIKTVGVWRELSKEFDASLKVVERQVTPGQAP